MSRAKTIKVEGISRIEGEGKLFIKVNKGLLEDVRLDIFEPPRFFEAFIKGRHFLEIPDMVSRICGICPVAHQMSAVHALEEALGVKLEGPVRDLRRVLYCGEWLESHGLHVYMLHAPDFVGCDDAIEMSRIYPVEVQRGIMLKKVGHEILNVLGGRAVHPISVRVGGFYKMPTREELQPLIEHLKQAREAALETIRWVSKLPIPYADHEFEFVSLRHPDEYPINEGRIVSNRGIDITMAEYEDTFVEEQVPYSNALHSRVKKRGAYLVGPLARYNMNFDKLDAMSQQAAREAGLKETCHNVHQGIIVRSVEALYACNEAIRLLERYEMPDKPYVDIQPRAGTGYSCTEAPRGMLYHHYELDENGLVKDAKIIPPTAQNQAAIEHDLWRLVKANLTIPQAQLTSICEQLIRTFDPCLSCSTHFLKLKIEEV